MPNMYKPMFALLAVTLVASFLLGVVFTVTEKPIAEQKARAESEAMSSLISGIENFETTTAPDGETMIEGSTVTKIAVCYDASGAVIGHVLSASPKGYSGAVEIMVGFDPAGIIQGVQIISHGETPGLGANAVQPYFIDQYKGKSGALAVTKSAPAGEDEILAIASATITTQAITDGVNDATSYFENYLKEGAEQ